MCGLPRTWRRKGPTWLRSPPWATCGDTRRQVAGRPSHADTHPHTDGTRAASQQPAVAVAHAAGRRARRPALAVDPGLAAPAIPAKSASAAGLIGAWPGR